MWYGLILDVAILTDDQFKQDGINYKSKNGQVVLVPTSKQRFIGEMVLDHNLHFMKNHQ